MDLGLTGAKAVISGGTQGIGLAVAKVLLREGASVSIAARRQEGVEAALEELSALGTAVGQVCDVSDHAVRTRPRLPPHQTHGNRRRGRKGGDFPGEPGGKLGQRDQRACGRSVHPRGEF